MPGSRSIRLSGEACEHGATAVHAPHLASSIGRSTEREDCMSLKTNILMVDDQPSKLLSYETILGSLGENLIRATSSREALNVLLKHEVAVVLMDVCMPDVDGFELASMIRQHPRYQRTAIILISAIHLTEADRLQGYDAGRGGAS